MTREIQHLCQINSTILPYLRQIQLPACRHFIEYDMNVCDAKLVLNILRNVFQVNK